MLATLNLALLILISLIWLMRISRGLLGIVVGGIEGYIFSSPQDNRTWNIISWSCY